MDPQPRLIDSPPRAPRRERSSSGRRRPRRSSRRRMRKLLRRYWPLLAAFILVVIMLLVLSVSASRRLAARTATRPEQDFGVTFVNRAQVPARLIKVRMVYPDQSVTVAYDIKDLAPGSVNYKRIYAPPGFELNVDVTMADGTTGRGKNSLSAGTIGGLRVVVHDQGKLSLD